MRVNKRLFPYPVLNRDKLLSRYKSSSIEISYGEQINKTNNQYVLKDICCHIDSKGLIDLIENNRAIIICVVESPLTMFRKHYEISTTPKDINICLSDLYGKIDVSCFVVATEEIDDYYDEDFAEEYGDLHFAIEKNDILAADDGYSNKIDFSDEESNKKASIFVVIKDDGIIDNTVQYDYDSDLISICLPPDQWKMYNTIKSEPKYLQNIWFSLFAIPALSCSILALQNNTIKQKEGDIVDSLRISYRWFDSFVTAYEKNTGIELSDDDFEKMDCNNAAQKVLNCAVTKAVETIFNITMNKNGGGELDGD